MDSTSISEEHLLNYYYLIYKLFKNFKWRRKCYNIPYNKYKVEGRETLSDFSQVSITHRFRISIKAKGLIFFLNA